MALTLAALFWGERDVVKTRQELPALVAWVAISAHAVSITKYFSSSLAQARRDAVRTRQDL